MFRGALETAQLRITNALNPFAGVCVGQVYFDQLQGFGQVASCGMTHASTYNFSAPSFHSDFSTPLLGMLTPFTLCSNPVQGSCPPPTC